jgi:hypothetical protein
MCPRHQHESLRLPAQAVNQTDWQQRDYVLNWFGPKQGEAKKTYRNYVKINTQFTFSILTV